MSKLGLLNLSQSHLNLLHICPPKFQQIYLDCLGSLPDPQQQENMAWGSRLHLLIQQRELDLPIKPFLTNDVDLDVAISALVDNVPELTASKQDLWREAEHYRSLGYGNYLLTTIFDLLILRAEQAIILDWKTYRKPRKRKELANNWQTRLYLYVLAETSEYLPEQITMTYWFIKSGKPTNLTFNYSQTLHQQTQEDLSALLLKLEIWLRNYQLHQIDFPHRSDCQSKCPYHQFLVDNTTDQSDRQELIKVIADIEEIPI